MKEISRKHKLCSTFFFFQAEDGIRDDLVTGVQTCALPIFRRSQNWIGGPGSTPDTASYVPPPPEDRKRGVEGKRVDLGGRRIIKKKKNLNDAYRIIRMQVLQCLREQNRN